MIITSLAVAIITADVNRDGIVNMTDGLHISSSSHDDLKNDANRDGVVDHRDFLAVLDVFRSGWGFHDTGDGQPWFVMPGDAVRVGASPFPGRRRLTFLDERGYEVAIDFISFGTQAALAPPTEPAP